MYVQKHTHTYRQTPRADDYNIQSRNVKLSLGSVTNELFLDILDLVGRDVINIRGIEAPLALKSIYLRQGHI